MKLIITLFLIVAATMCACAQDFINGGIYVKSSTENLKFSWVGQGSSTNEVLKIGKTYSSDKNMFELATKDQQEAIFQLSSGLLVQVSPNSEFRVDAFNQMIADANVEPESLKAGDFILNVALMNGSAYFVAPKYASSNTMCVLQTPLMNLELNGGKYHVKTSPKFTFVYVLDGTVGIFDNQTNKKTVKQAGTMVLIFPSPIRATETMVTEKVIDTAETRKMSDTIRQLESSKPQVMFSLVNGKILGIRLQ
jgi:hypothetical protein